MKRIAGGWGGDCDMFERKLELVSEAFVVCPLSETPENERLISDFSAGNNALGLEDFLKKHAQRVPVGLGGRGQRQSDWLGRKT